MRCPCQEMLSILQVCHKTRDRDEIRSPGGFGKTYACLIFVIYLVNKLVCCNGTAGRNTLRMGISIVQRMNGTNIRITAAGWLIHYLCVIQSSILVTTRIQTIPVIGWVKRLSFKHWGGFKSECACYSKKSAIKGRKTFAFFILVFAFVT